MVNRLNPEKPFKEKIQSVIYSFNDKLSIDEHNELNLMNR